MNDRELLNKQFLKDRHRSKNRKGRAFKLYGCLSCITKNKDTKEEQEVSVPNTAPVA